MTAEKIREVMAAQPFRPFRLHMGGGRFAEVRHPEMVSLSPVGRTCVVWGPGDKMEIIDVLMVQSIEMLTGGSGKPKRRKAG